MAFTLRLADTKNDVAQILSIYAPYILNTTVTFEYEVPSIMAFERRIEQISNQFPWLVCEQSGQIIGYAYASKQYERAAYAWNAELSVYVAPKAQRMGIGTALYQALIGLLKMQGYCNVSVRIQIPNEKSVALHRAFGFEEAGIMRSIGNKFGRWLDMLSMTKQIGEYVPSPQPPIAVTALDRNKIRLLLSECAQQK